MASSIAALVALLLLQLSIATSEDPCHPNPCGLNTLCEVDNKGALCKCQPGYLWSPSAGCHHECENNSECSPQMACVEFKCQNSCSQCGLNAECEDVQNHAPVCKCPKGYFGNPLFSCHPECTQHSHCPPGKPTCFNNSCTNPCEGMCGIAANCELRNGITPVCSCPKDMAGDPLVMCRPITNNDLCEPKIQPRYTGYTGDPLYNCTRAECLDNSECRSHLACKNERCVDPCQNVCGANAFCETKNHRPICKCLLGYTGDPFYNCTRAECLENSECRSHLACKNERCVDPCQNVCGANAFCETKNHRPICECLLGYTGDPLYNCTRAECLENSECRSHLACKNERCVNPCQNVCGANAFCETKNHRPTCECLLGYTGDPLYNCTRAECLENSECRSHLACKNERCVDPCQNVCGPNALCDTKNHVPICTCLPGHTGDPFYNCTRAECLENSECRSHLACIDEHCVNPCQNVCGANANCETRNHVPICTCLPGYTGDPFTNCRRFDSEELCHPSPCGVNTLCEVVNNVPTCKCEPGYYGSPIAGCRHECENNAECGSQMACIEFRCQNPCSQCGLNADCEVVQNHVPVCKCPRGYIGNPLSSCQPECTKHSDCPPGKPACFYKSCKNPCDGVCGIAANCDLRNGITPVCSCPKDMTGDPFVMCRPFTKEELCKPNPCGTNAKCQPGYDRYNKERPVCTCLAGYIGDPIKGCTRGICAGVCGIAANCNLRNGITPVCSCPKDMTGDPFVMCRPFTKDDLCKPNPCGANAKCEPGYDRYNKERPVCTCHTGYIGDPIKGCTRRIY